MNEYIENALKNKPMICWEACKFFIILHRKVREDGTIDLKALCECPTRKDNYGYFKPILEYKEECSDGIHMNTPIITERVRVTKPFRNGDYTVGVGMYTEAEIEEIKAKLPTKKARAFVKCLDYGGN